MRKENNKKKGFVLASTLVSIVVITMVSFLMITLVTTTTVSNRYLSNYSNKKIQAEQIFNDFKNDNLLNYEDINITTYTNSLKTNIRAILIEKNNQKICFGIYDFSQNEVVCYQISGFNFEINENDNLIFGELIFSKDEKSDNEEPALFLVNFENTNNTISNYCFEIKNSSDNLTMEELWTY